MATPPADLRVAALAARVGLAFQDPDRQIFAGRVRAEVAFGPRNLGLRGPALEAAVGQALTTVGLADQANTNPYDLGFSDRKLLALASILAMSTPTVVLDEPTTGQDRPGVERIQAIVASLAAAGRTIVAVSHDMRFVAETFGRVVVMESGRVTLDGSAGGGVQRAELARPGSDPCRPAAGRPDRFTPRPGRDADRCRPDRGTRRSSVRLI